MVDGEGSRRAEETWEDAPHTGYGTSEGHGCVGYTVKLRLRQERAGQLDARLPGPEENCRRALEAVVESLKGVLVCHLKDCWFSEWSWQPEACWVSLHVSEASDGELVVEYLQKTGWRCSDGWSPRVLYDATKVVARDGRWWKGEGEDFAGKGGM